MDKFCITQKTPTQRSATAKLARKKLVVLRRRRDKVTTRITRRFPETMHSNQLSVFGRSFRKGSVRNVYERWGSQCKTLNVPGSWKSLMESCKFKSRHSRFLSLLLLLSISIIIIPEDKDSESGHYFQLCSSWSVV